MDRGGEIPLYAWKPRRKHHERHSTTSTRKDWTRPPHNFHQDKGTSRRPCKRTSRQVGRRRKTKREYSLVPPNEQTIFYWTDNGTMHCSPMNPTVRKKIELQISQQQLKIHTGSIANFLTREDISRDLLGKFHKNRSVWIRARQRMLQCLSYQIPCALQLKQWGILNDVKRSLCEKYYKKKNIRDPPDTVESVGHIQCYCPVVQLPQHILTVNTGYYH